MFSNFISFPVFLVSLAVGLLFVYLDTPPLTKILVYPTPDNIDTFQYKDKAENCFKFNSTLVDCPKDTSLIKHIPFQN